MAFPPFGSHIGDVRPLNIAEGNTIFYIFLITLVKMERECEENCGLRGRLDAL